MIVDDICEIVLLMKRSIHLDGLVQGCGYSIAITLELPQPCTKPAMYSVCCSSGIVASDYLKTWLGPPCIWNRYQPVVKSCLRICTASKFKAPFQIIIIQRYFKHKIAQEAKSMIKACYNFCFASYVHVHKFGISLKGAKMFIESMLKCGKSSPIVNSCMRFSVLTGLLFLIDDCKGKSHTVARILMQSQPVSPRFVKPELWFTYNNDGVCFLRRVSVAVVLMWWYSCKWGCTFLSDTQFALWNISTVILCFIIL